MKNILALIALLALVVGANAQNVGFSAVSVTGAALNAGTNYVIIPPDSKNNGEALVTYLNCNALFASGTCTLTSYVSTNQTTANFTNSTTTVYVASTNGFAPGQYVVIQHLQNPFPRFRNEAAKIASLGTTNLVLASTPAQTVVPGDPINQQTAWAAIPFASSTTAREFNGPGILSGQRAEPFLIVIEGSAVGTNTINAACATFIP